MKEVSLTYRHYKYFKLYFFSFPMISDGEIVWTEVVDPKKVYIFIVDNVFI